ncbi:unnamed protein product [Lactuca virosa]|uniref:Transposase (putative) gypsy type domain-containing protein n=1 Tax=Lactuca virosa TaxID=75947 RepID=A0AAU9PH40_9ASTR|nr:unnamed protein product [Lactuca virosa]
MLGFQLPSPSSSVIDPPCSKVGLYLRHIVYGLRLHPSSFFLEVLCFYKVHLVKLCPNVVSKVLTFKVFCVAHEIPLDVALFHYFYRLKRYGDRYSFSSRHFPLSPYLTRVTDGSKCPFQLTSYLPGEFPPEAIMLDDVIPDPDVELLFGTSCPSVAPSGVGSSRYKEDGCPSRFQFEEDLDEACRLIARDENIISYLGEILSSLMGYWPYGISF